MPFKLLNPALNHPRSIIGISVAVTIAAAVLGLSIELRTSRRDLVTENDPTQLRYDRLQEEFSGPNPLIVCIGPAASTSVESSDLRSAVDEVAAVLVNEPLIDNVFYRVPEDWLIDNGIHLVPAEQLTAIADRVAAMVNSDDGPVQISGFGNLNELLARRIEMALESNASLPQWQDRREIEVLRRYLDAHREFLANPVAYTDWLLDNPIMELALGEDSSFGGYLTSHNDDLFFLLVTPVDPTYDEAIERRLVDAVRSHVTGALAQRPNLVFGLTGRPALTVDEMGSLGRDAWRTSGLAILGVTLLAFLAFQRRLHALLGLVALIMGVAWAIAAVRLELGYLNMITTAMIPILIGLGIDYVIHPLSQYELEHATCPEGAVHRAFALTTPAVVVSALTTAVAFFCLLLMDFRGFSELGLVAGIGVILCLVAAVLVLPALLMVRENIHRIDPRSIADTKPRAPIDHLWSHAAVRRICARPRTTVAVGMLSTALLGVSATRVAINLDIVQLLPRNAESVRYLETLTDESDLTAHFNVVVASNLESLRELQQRALREPHVARFESILRFLPLDAPAAARSMARLGELLAGLSLLVPETGSPLLNSADESTATSQLQTALLRLEGALDAAAETAFTTGLTTLIGPLEQARMAAAEAAATTPTSGWLAQESRLLDRASDLLKRLRLSVASSADDVDSLPSNIRRRFTTGRGHYIGYLYPNGNVFDHNRLKSFQDASRRISPDVLGFPTLFEIMAEHITSGLYLALLVGGLAVFTMLLIDLRDVRLVLYAMSPVGIGLVWMLGLMPLLGLTFNLANLVAVPLVLGIGIDNGIHLIHRHLLEGPSGMVTVLRHTGRAILIGSLTTMVGFASLGMASHRGLASLGWLLLIGVGATLVASLVVLPNLLVITRRTVT